MGRENEVDIVSILTSVFKRWKNDPSKYLLPSLEYVVDIIIFFTVGAAIYLPFVLIIRYFEIFDDAAGAILTVRVLASIGAQLFLMLMTFFLRAILDGGTVKTLTDIKNGKEYRFFDIFRNGWKSKWVYLKIEMTLLLLFVVFVIFILGPFGIVIIMIFIISDPIISAGFGLIFIMLALVFLAIVFALLLIPVSLIYYPIFFLAFANNEENDTGAFESVTRSIAWVNRNKKQSFIYGLLYFAGSLLINYIPFIGIAFIGFLEFFALDMAGEIVKIKVKK